MIQRRNRRERKGKSSLMADIEHRGLLSPPSNATKSEVTVFFYAGPIIKTFFERRMR
jgi:hypothetical protein